MQIRNLTTTQSIYNKNLRNLANLNSKVSFTSIQRNKKPEDDFSEELKLDRREAGFALILTYLVIGVGMFFLVKSCSMDKKTPEKKQLTQAEEKIEK